jgi:hypothetical protein
MKFDALKTFSGHPDDKSLRKVETEVLIPKIMRDRAKAEKCVPEVKAFEECCKDCESLISWMLNLLMKIINYFSKNLNGGQVSRAEQHLKVLHRIVV